MNTSLKRTNNQYLQKQTFVNKTNEPLTVVWQNSKFRSKVNIRISHNHLY